MPPLTSVCVVSIALLHFARGLLHQLGFATDGSRTYPREKVLPPRASIFVVIEIMIVLVLWRPML